MVKSNYEYWTFIENYYPNYYSSNDVLLSNILSEKLENNEIEDELNLINELINLDTKLFNQALENYFLNY